MVRAKIGKEQRNTPFIIKCGKYYHVAADGKIFLDSLPSSMEALVNLIAIYYAFNIRWCSNILSACLFLEKVLLEQDTEPEKRSLELRRFLENFMDLKTKVRNND